MRRSKTQQKHRCHWCKEEVSSTKAVTEPRFTDMPELPRGTGVVVCGDDCPRMPNDAKVSYR